MRPDDLGCVGPDECGRFQAFARRRIGFGPDRVGEPLTQARARDLGAPVGFETSACNAHGRGHGLFASENFGAHRGDDVAGH